MNQYNKDRIEHIIAMLMYITGLPKNAAFQYIKNTIVYHNILSDDELTIYESYPSNLLSMVTEWKENNEIPLSLRNITTENIVMANSWLKEQSFQDATQAVDFLSTKNSPTTFCKTTARKPRIESSIPRPRKQIILNFLNSESHKEKPTLKLGRTYARNRLPFNPEYGSQKAAARKKRIQFNNHRHKKNRVTH